MTRRAAGRGTPADAPRSGDDAAPGGERPLRRDAERNRLRILRAAAEMFTERGLDVTLDDVADRAGVGVGTVYRRFPNKEALAEALLADKLSAVADRACSAVANPDPWEGLVSYLEGSMEQIATDRGLRQVLMHSTYGKVRVDEERGRLQQAVTELVERARREGAVRDDIAPSDLALINFMLSAAAEYAWDVRPAVWRRYLVMILDGLRPARSAPTQLPVPALDRDEMRLAFQAPTSASTVPAVDQGGPAAGRGKRPASA